MAGWVYAFATRSMPGVVKIGATTRDPSERLAEANASDTWRPPHPYDVVCAVEVADAFESERAVHAILAARRVGTRSAREFFEITQLEARVLLSLLAVATETPEKSETYAAQTVTGPPRVIHAAPPCGGQRAWGAGAPVAAAPRMVARGQAARVGRAQLHARAAPRERQRHKARGALRGIHVRSTCHSPEGPRPKQVRRHAQFRLPEHRAASK